MNTDTHRCFMEPRNTRNNTERVFNPIEFDGIRSFNYGESATINRVEFEAIRSGGFYK